MRKIFIAIIQGDDTMSLAAARPQGVLKSAIYLCITLKRAIFAKIYY
jgi:hypothetical protein